MKRPTPEEFAFLFLGWAMIGAVIALIVILVREAIS